MSQTFNVLRTVWEGNFSKYEELARTQQTKHFVERNHRVEAYNAANLLETTFIHGFIVDKNHPNGDEMHFLNPNGLVYIMNCRTGRLITILGARPGQIRRYFEALNMPVDEDLATKAYGLLNQGYNTI